MNLHHIFIIFIFNFYCSDGSPYYLNYMMKKDVFCGERLRKVLTLVCHGQYYTPKTKRSPSNDVFSFDNAYSNDFDPDENSNDFHYPFLQKDSALSLLPNKVRRTHGIVNECCYKPCTMDTIKEYCDD